jgi:hypothetical protein
MPHSFRFFVLGWGARINTIYTQSSKKNATVLNYCNYVNYYLKMIQYIWKHIKTPQVSFTICIQTCFCLLPLGRAVNVNGDSTTRGVQCSTIREFRIGHHYKVNFANNFKAIHQVVRQTFFGGTDSSRRKGAFAKGKILGWPRLPEENMDRIKESYARSPRKSLSRELSIPQTTLWRVLRTWLVMKSLQSSF